jgi:hypothetical protein
MVAASIAKVTSISTTNTIQAPATIIQVGHTNVLTVGAGMEFATLGDALKAAVSGDTIAVQAGTYTNDFGTVTANVSILAVDGLVHEVATVPPPDDKGILTVNASLTIQGFTFTGGSDGSPDGNVAGIRLQAGNLNASYCSFTGMQEGLLADPDQTASVRIDHCAFLDNGTGDGYTHNLYVGSVYSLLVTDSLFEGAVVGHEIKSRAMHTTIEHNMIIDGPTGTASYDIDIPNAGVAVIEDNTIEKGPDASNDYAIHYGGETQFSYAQNALQVSGNTIINDLADSVPSVAVLNQSAVNGLNTVAQIQGNNFYNYKPQNIAIGNANVTGNTTLATEPVYSTPSPLLALPTVALGSGPQVLNLTNGNHVVTGGTEQLIVCDTAGSNSINGGTGGLQLSANAGWDQISTAAGTSDTINLPGRSSVLDSHGADHINASGAYELVEATGAATIDGTGFSTYDLDGANEVLTTACSGDLNVGAAGMASVHDLNGDLALNVAAGGTLKINDGANTPYTAAALATVTGAVSGAIANSGTLSFTTSGTGAFVQAGSGPVDVAGGSGNDTMVAAGGTDMFSLGSGQDSIVFDGGTASVTAGTGVDTYVFQSGGHGSDTITGFKQGTDQLVFQKFAHTAITFGSVVNGSTLLTLSDGTTIDLAGVTLPGYAQASGAGGQPTSGSAGAQPASSVPSSPANSGNGATQAPSSGSVTLTSGGHDLTGGSTKLAVTDAAGGNTIAGGAGGLSAVAANSDALTTTSGSTNQIALGCYDTLAGGGTDQVTVSGYRNSITEAGAANISLLGTVNTVQGGAGLVQVSDTAGGCSITGGAGGLQATLAGTYDQVTSQQGTADTISLGGYGTLLSQGTDKIALSGMADAVTVTGASALTAGGGYATYALNGTDSLTTAGAFAATVGGAASVGIGSTGSGGDIDKLAGGALVLSQVLGTGSETVTVGGGQAACCATGGGYAGITVTVTGGCAVTAGTGPVTVSGAGASGSAADSVYAGAGALLANAGPEGLNLMAGGGNVTLNGGSGNDAFTGGAGKAVLNLGSGGDSITFGNGATTVSGGVADKFFVPGGSSGTATILNWTSQDSFVTPGAAAPAIVSDQVIGGSTFLAFQGGAQIELVGVSHFP